MNKWFFFLRKIKLIEDFQIVIPLSNSDLVKKMDILLYQDRDSFFSGNYSSKSQFIGKVNANGFEIKNNLMHLSGGKVLVIANGSFTDLKDKTKINIEIKGFDTFMHFFYGIQVLIYSIFILYLLLNIGKIINQPVSLETHLPFWKIVLNFVVSFFAFFLVTIYPYFKMRRCMEEMEDDLRRELYLLSKE